MTDRNTAYRMDYDTQAEDDPLAELERIISGRPETPQSAPQPIPGAAPSSMADDDLQAMLEAGFEDALAGELDAQAQSLAPASTQGFRQTQETGSASLEDQLMAELDAEGATGITAPAAPRPVTQPPRSLATPRPAVAPVTPNGETNAIQPANEQGTIEAGGPNDPLERLEAVARSLGNEMPASGAHSHANDEDLESYFAEQFAAIGAGNEAADDIGDLPAADASLAADPADDLEAQFAESFAREFDLDVSRDMKSEATGGFSQADTTGVGFPDFLERELESHPDTAHGAGVNQRYAGETYAGAADIRMDAHGPDGFSDEDPDQPAPQRSRSAGGFRLAIAALIAALAIGLGVVAWGTLNNTPAGPDGEPPVIRADAEPAKVKPADSGGTEIANQENQVYDRVAGTGGEQAVQDELITTRDEPVDIAAKSDSRLAPDAAGTEPQGALGLAPKRVRTLVVKPDGTIVASEEPSSDESLTTRLALAPAGDAAAADASEQSLAPQGLSAGQEATDGAASIDGAVTTGQIAVPQSSPLPAPQQPAAEPVERTQPLEPRPVVQAPAQPQPQPAAQAQPAADPNAPTQIAALSAGAPQPAAAQPAPTPTVTSSDWKVQVSAQRSREAAEASFNNIRQRFSSIVGDRTAIIERADVENRGTFYRAKILAQSQGDATELCNRIKRAGGDCLVTR